MVFFLALRGLALAGPDAWSGRGPALWDQAAKAGEVSLETPTGQKRACRAVGRVDFLAPDAAQKAEIEAQSVPEYRTARGELIQTNRRELVDPIDGTGAEISGGALVSVPPPFDHGSDGSPLGLKVGDARNENASFYNRIGIRLPDTPAGRLLFVFEMSGPNGENPQWFSREIESPLPGCPWRPVRRAVKGPDRKTHLRKLAVFLLEPWKDPSGRIPAKLKREDLAIDFDASQMSWAELKDWIVKNINDGTVSPGKPYVIQLPQGEITDDGLPFVSASRWQKWGAAIQKLTGGRKVWFVGHPTTCISGIQLSQMANLGVLFCRITRLGPDRLAEVGDKPPPMAMVGLDGDNLDIRNNWIECPDGVNFGGIGIRSITSTTIVDNIIATSGASITTPGGTRVTSSIIARNWMERGHDAVQMYGSWVDAIIAYNHFAGASGSANREAGSPNLGANLHSDEFQSQANQTDRFPQSFCVFSNFAQFGRHNWPPNDAELGGGTQNVIIDGDSYTYTHFYWNVFQNLAPGYRGFMSINPDKDWVAEDPSRSQRDYIENLAVMGNAFLDRLDFNNRPPQGYIRGLSTIGGRYNQPLFELINSENVYAVTGGNEFPAPFKGFVDGRPDPVVRTGWQKGSLSLSDVYEKPILYKGSHDTRYDADFSRTTYAGDKFLEGFASPKDYTPKAPWTQSPGRAARLAPGSELAKVAPMPTDLAAFLGDSSRVGSFFGEFSGQAVSARKQTLPAPWRPEAKNDGFLLHVKLGSVGKPGTRREIIRESDGKGLQYSVALTERDTAAFELKSGDEVLSRVESADTFKNGDHLTMQIYTPYFPLVSESHFPSALLAQLHGEGIRKIRYVTSAQPPALPPDTREEIGIWLDPGRNHRFFQRRDGKWVAVKSAVDSIHASALRALHTGMKTAGQAPAPANKGTSENFLRDAYPIPSDRTFTLHLDGKNDDSAGSAQEFDLRWVRQKSGVPAILMWTGGKWGGGVDFSSMPLCTGRPRCFIRHNIDHQYKKLDWIWTPGVDLPRGDVVLFDGFDGSYETFRVIRGGQGQYGLPSYAATYRILESIASAMSFIRPPLDESGRVPGWGAPEIFLNARAASTATGLTPKN